MGFKPLNVLFLCTGNSARSILAEALLNEWGSDRFCAYSAGSKPVGQPNPYAIEHLDSHGIATDFARSKSWEEFAQTEGVEIDLVITVCDSAAREVCPIFPGRALMAHWGLPDPAGLTDDRASRIAFKRTHSSLKKRILAMLALNIEALSGEDLVRSVNKIGRYEDAL